MSNLLKIEDLKKELYVEDFRDCFCAYASGYICDIITEIAKKHINKNLDDLLMWAEDNTYYIENAIEKYGIPTSYGKANFKKIIQQGQFYTFEKELYDNLDDYLKYFAYTYTKEILDFQEITEEQNKNLLNYNYADEYDKIEHIINHIKKVFDVE